jgi:hypothetical protein
LSAALGCELLDGIDFTADDQARTARFDFIADFCNRRRHHSVNGDLSPRDHEIDRDEYAVVGEERL